ncbi:MAG: hypothetical protein KAH01_04510 [Caldisericia bacterium]|nr:hypothetical protein [Caldisericia bacterium]
MKLKKAITCLAVVFVIIVCLLVIFRRDIYRNYTAYEEDNYYNSIKNDSASQMNEKFVFDSVQKPIIQSLQYQTLLGYHSYHLKNLNPALFTTQNGLYTVDWVNLHDYIQQGFWKEKLITRTDLHGNILWNFRLEKIFRGSYTKEIYTSSAFVDEEENIYVQGKVWDRYFLWGKWVPRNQPCFLISIDKDGDINWIHFSDINLLDSHGVVKDQKVYLTTLTTNSRQDKTTILCINSRNGKKLWDKETEIRGDFVFYSSFGIHIANSFADEENQMLHAKIQTVSYEGEKLWDKSFDFPVQLNESLRYRDQILFSANQQHLYICFCYDGWVGSRVSLEGPFSQTSQIVSFDSSGIVEWEYLVPQKENKWIHAMECNLNQLCVAGGMTTQAENAAKDVFLTSFSPEGKITWNTYIKGEEKEPYVFWETGVDPGGSVFLGLYLQMTNNKIVLATSTQSENIPIQNGAPFNLFLPVVPYKKPTTKPCYSVLYMYNTEGTSLFSTYTTTSSTKEQRINCLETTVNLASEYFVADWIYDLKIHNDKVYILSTTNNPNTLLTNPAISSFSYCERNFIGYFYLLSCYEM